MSRREDRECEKMFTRRGSTVIKIKYIYKVYENKVTEMGQREGFSNILYLIFVSAK